MTEFGDPLLPARFWTKVQVAESGCWLWIAGRNAKGYGVFTTNRKQSLAHRLSYATLVGPIPARLQTDHLCRVRNCVNPAHLEPVTNYENTQRAVVVRTHCPRGHAYTDYRLTDGRRRCHVCVIDNQRRRYAAKRAVA